MKLIIGLGNPGKSYSQTRHNVGFMALDELISNLSGADGQFSDFSPQPKFNAEISQGNIGGEKIILAKPQTFMNESGIAAKAIADYYKIPSEEIIVIHDDLDIKLGDWKLAKDRGAAGHRGVKSIIEKLGTKNFVRLRIGITPESSKPENVPDFVLKSFEDDERAEIKPVIEKMPGVIKMIAVEGFDKTLNASK